MVDDVVMFVIFGVYRDVVAAFYLTALVLRLFEAALVPAQLVYARVGRHRA